MNKKTNDEKVILQLQDLRHLQWTKIRNSSGTAGSFLKASARIRGERWYYKLSDYDPYRGIVGHECVNEIIADRLLTILQIPHLSYQLIHALVLVDGKEYVTWLCRSKDYRQNGESKIALDTYYQMEKREGESPLEFCFRQGWEKYISEMLLVDFLILNRDRHGANVEVLRNRQTKTIRLAPLFDHGLSLCFSLHEEESLNAVDPMADRPVQCFVGSHSATENLNLIPQKYRKVTPVGSIPLKEGREAFPAQREVLRESDRDLLFTDLEEAISEKRREVIWQMIWERWNYYESFCNT